MSARAVLTAARLTEQWDNMSLWSSLHHQIWLYKRRMCVHFIIFKVLLYCAHLLTFNNVTFNKVGDPMQRCCCATPDLLLVIPQPE